MWEKKMGTGNRHNCLNEKKENNKMKINWYICVWNQKNHTFSFNFLKNKSGSPLFSFVTHQTWLFTSYYIRKGQVLLIALLMAQFHSVVLATDVTGPAFMIPAIRKQDTLQLLICKTFISAIYSSFYHLFCLPFVWGGGQLIVKSETHQS